jgi:VanZ family protein
MQNEMKIKTDKIRIVWRVITTLACALMLLFIFSNSLQTAEASSKQSLAMVDTIQDVASVIAPQSPIATATGAEFDFLHACIRNIAHFLEYALLGSCAFGLFLSYSRGKRYAFFPVAFACLTAVFDEFTQTLSDGRAAEWTDFLVDSVGVLAGSVFALVVFFIGLLIVRRTISRVRVRS